PGRARQAADRTEKPRASRTSAGIPSDAVPPTGPGASGFQGLPESGSETTIRPGGTVQTHPVPTMAYPKRPLEFYGLPAVSPPSEEMRRALAEQDCPFRERRCIKVRKSEPGQTIGACVVGFQGAAILICPHRMTDGGTIFRNAALLLSDDAQRRGRIRVVPEVTMPGGSIDYFIVAFGNRGEILDFVGLEIQTLDTTGTKGVWDCRVDLAAGRRLATRYEYGLNWKMTAKTILVQILHKAVTFEMLGKKLVLTIQREFF